MGRVGPSVKGLQVNTVHPLQICLHTLRVCRISKTNQLLSPLKTCDTLPHPRVMSVEPPWLETTHLKKYLYKPCTNYFVQCYGAQFVISVDCEFLKNALFMLIRE